MKKKTEELEITGDSLEMKEKRFKELQKKMEKDFGEGSLITANERPKEIEVISTGSLSLDKALGVGGLPRGRITEIYGPESSGKTTLAIHVIAEAHKNPDSLCAFVDVEHAFDVKYAEAVGVDLSRLKISQPSFGEEALQITEALSSTGDFDVVVVDSVAALLPKAEDERKMGESSMGKHALLMSQAMRKLTPGVSESGTVLIFINQLRDKIGVMFGSPETTTGGNALKFYASVRLDIRKMIGKDSLIKDGEVKIGNPVRVRVVKNKVAPPFRETQFNILYGVGIDKMGEILELAVTSDIIHKSGSWFSYKGEKLGQGSAAVKKLLMENAELYKEIEERIHKEYVPNEFSEYESEDQKDV